MKQRRCALFLSKALFALSCALVLTSTVFAMKVTEERMPDGTYCGTYGTIVEGRLTTTKGTDTFDIYLEALDEELVCKDEKYIYDPNTHTAVIPGATDPNDCIGQALANQGLSLKVTYDPKSDVITLDLDIAKIECEKCG